MSALREKPQEKPKIIDSLWTFLVATAVIGPFALPLLWRNPRYKTSTKIAGSIAVLAFTAFLMWGFGRFMKMMTEQLLLIQ
jgi:hypothetical protein